MKHFPMRSPYLRRVFCGGLAVVCLLLPGTVRAGESPLQVTPRVDLTRFMGTWYEIASVPSFFQQGCVATRARYSRKQDGNVQVVNECRKETFDGKLSAIEGRVWQPDPAAPGKLKVAFFWPLSADYWIMELDPGYQYAVVGEPDREKLWVLSRTPQLDEAVYRRLLQNAARQGYDVSRLVRTRQPLPDTRMPEARSP